MAYNFNDIINWGKWGICGDADDLYESPKRMLREAMASGKPFDTGWHGFSKVEESMRIIRGEDGEYMIYVSDRIDSAYDDDASLIYDCVTDSEAEQLTDEIIQNIRDEMNWTDYRDEDDDSDWLHADATLEDIMQCAKEAIDMVQKRLHESYLICMDVTLTVLYGYPEDRTKIVERLKEADKGTA